VQATHPPHQAACTQQQIDDYAHCQAEKNQTLCTQFKPGGTAEACGKCIETPSTDTWGVIVFSGSTASMNVEGCVNVALGTFDCGNALHQLYQCEEIVCSGCTGSDFQLCELESVNSAAGPPVFCAPYAAVVDDPSGPCAAINGDAGIPCEAQNCFPSTACTDSTAQQIDWLERIVGYMCGDSQACPVPAADHCP
jgi:hypothetical protein